jgi:hypothetical protein
VTRSARGRARAVRAAVFSLLAVALAVGAHALGGGGTPSPATTLVLWAAVLPVAGLLAGRTWGPGSLTCVLGALELALHHALGLASAGSASAAPPLADHVGTAAPHAAHAAHGAHGAGAHGLPLDTVDAGVHGLPPALPDAAVHAASAHTAAGHDHETGLLMLAGHVLATVVTAVLLAHGDALLAQVRAWTSLRHLPRTGCPVLVVRPVPPVWRVRPAASPLVAAGGVGRRGPPRG